MQLIMMFLDFLFLISNHTASNSSSLDLRSTRSKASKVSLMYICIYVYSYTSFGG